MLSPPLGKKGGDICERYKFWTALIKLLLGEVFWTKRIS